jgi:hypothetical protein
MRELYFMRVEMDRKGPCKVTRRWRVIQVVRKRVVWRSMVSGVKRGVMECILAVVLVFGGCDPVGRVYDGDRVWFGWWLMGSVR